MKESGTSIMLHEMKTLQGKSISQIARETGMSRNTVRKYLQQGETPHAGKGRRKSSKLDAYKDVIAEMMTLGVFNAGLVFERLQTLGYDGGMTIVKNYLSPLRPATVRMPVAVRRYDTKPGRQAQMDWGYMDYRDLRGQLHKVACFVMILGSSRMKYVEFVRRCDESSLQRCILHAFEYYGGVPEVVLTDHMKTVIQSIDNGKPVWNAAFERFASEMHFIPKVCRVRRPQTKGKVERLVEYVRGNFLPGRHFSDFGDLQRQVLTWCDQVNRRVHGTTGEKPVDLLKAEGLQPLPGNEICQAYRWEARKVSREGFVSYDGVFYGVHWKHCGETLWVMNEGSKISLLDQHGQLLQEHEICHKSRRHLRPKGQYAGLTESKGIAHLQPCAIQIPTDEVAIRALSVYERIAEVG